MCLQRDAAQKTLKADFKIRVVMGKGDGHGMGSGLARGKTERVAVPAMPMWMAIICCILNFLIPGLGTIIAGFSTFCCARNEDMSTGSRVGSCCVSFSIGLLQLITIALLLFGWIWSCVWGVFFIGMSAEYYHDNPPDNTLGTVVTQPSTQSTVIIQPAAPAPGGYYPQQPGPQWNPQQPGPQWNQPGYQQGYVQPANPNIPQGPPGPGYPGPSQYPPYGGELPPAYEEHQSTPSAPPPEKS